MIPNSYRWVRKICATLIIAGSFISCSTIASASVARSSPSPCSIFGWQRFHSNLDDAWAWWALAVSGVVGFGSFLTYLGYGYLDTWHGAATLVLLPCFTAGLWISRRLVLTKAASSGTDASWRSLLRSGVETDWRSRAGFGRLCLLMAAIGMIGAGFTIQTIGMTCVFVPTDLTFMGLDRRQLDAINIRLVPLIAHDRAGFGGGVATAGLLLFASVWCGVPSRSLWQALLWGGIAGWSTAIGVHPLIGYLDAGHLAPAVAGAMLFFMGLVLYAAVHVRRGLTSEVRAVQLRVSPNRSATADAQPARSPSSPHAQVQVVCAIASTCHVFRYERPESERFV